MTMKRNLAIERLKSLLPVLGNDASLKNHIRNAINNAGDLKSVINNLEKIEIKDAPENSTKLLEAFKNEVKALREEAQTGEIKGDNFITKESPAPKSDLNVKMDLAPNVRDLSKITTEEISADLDYLASKHPEMFSKPSDFFRLIREIKNEPTHFFNNNRLDYALIVKRMDENKIGKLAIDKESGEVKHATKVKEKDLKRLDKVSRENSKDAGIIQTFIQPGSKSNSELGLPDEIISKQTQNGNSHLVGSPTPTQLTLGEATEPTADGAKALLDEKELTRTPALETSLNKEDGELLKLSNKSIIPQKDKNTKTINASPHIASGLLGGTANGTDENGNVSPEEFAKGFIYALFGSKFSASAVKRINPELYNSILGLGKKMPQMAKDNPKLLTKIYGSAKSNSINSFAGEKALNASANKLSKAKAMLEKGEDEVKIWQSTGWYKDKDGAWKFEIDDSPAKIKNQNADKLGDLLEHKELFKAYPELKDINVVKIKDELYNKNLKDWHKESSPLTKNIDGTPKIFYHGTKKSNISEFDQKFDKSKWGFFFTTDKGLSEEYSKGRYGLKEPNSGVMEVYINAKKPFDLREEITKDTANKYQALLGNLAKRDDLKNGVGKSLYEYIKNTSLKQYDTKARAFKDKLQNAGYDSIILDDNVIVAFNPNQIKHVKNNGNFNKENDIYALGNKGYYDPVKKEIGLSEIADKSTLMHEIQHAIQDIEGFAKGSNTNDKKYALSHGEAEARNVQNRLDLNKKGRAHPHETFDVNPNETFVSREYGVNFSQKLPELKEKRGIYNVTYNGKNATQIKQDLDNINDAIKYERGNIGKGAKHISIRHLDDENKAGFVTKEELLNLGENVRNFIKEYKEPFVNKKNARIYEWEDDKGVRFKLVVSNKNGEGRGLPLDKSQDVSSITNDLRPATKKGLSPSGSLNNIITFYSDRNLKEPMKFENPKLKLLDAIDNSGDKVGAVEKILLNKHISDGVKAKAVNRLTKNKISQGVKISYISTKNSNNN